MARNKAGAVKRKKLKKMKCEEARKNPKPRSMFSRQPRSLEELDRMEREQQSQPRIIPIMDGWNYMIPMLMAEKRNNKVLTVDMEGRKEK